MGHEDFIMCLHMFNTPGREIKVIIPTEKIKSKGIHAAQQFINVPILGIKEPLLSQIF